jgi:hypothetical protein
MDAELESVWHPTLAIATEQDSLELTATFQSARQLASTEDVLVQILATVLEQVSLVPCARFLNVNHLA